MIRKSFFGYDLYPRHLDVEISSYLLSDEIRCNIYNILQLMWTCYLSADLQVSDSDIPTPRINVIHCTVVFLKKSTMTTTRFQSMIKKIIQSQHFKYIGEIDYKNTVKQWPRYRNLSFVSEKVLKSFQHDQEAFPNRMKKCFVVLVRF